MYELIYLSIFFDDAVVRKVFFTHYNNEPCIYIIGLFGEINSILFLVLSLISFINKLCYMCDNYYTYTPDILKKIYKYFLTNTILLIPHLIFIYIISYYLLYLFNSKIMIFYEWNNIYIYLWLVFCNLLMLIPFFINLYIFNYLENKYMRGFCGEWDDRKITHIGIQNEGVIEIVEKIEFPLVHSYSEREPHIENSINEEEEENTIDNKVFYEENSKLDTKEKNNKKTLNK